MGFLNGVTLCLTTRCNLTCSYCSQKDYYLQICRQNDMPIETALTATTLIKERGNISFFGGEPMLLFSSLIKEVVRNNNDKYFAVVSNGTAPFENYDWLHHNSNCFFRISYDGKTSDRGEKHRLTFTTIENLVKIKARLRVRVTITPVSLKIFPDTIKELISIGVREVWFEVEDGFNLQDKNLVSALFLKIKEVKALSVYSGLILKTSALFSGPCEVRKAEDVYVLPDGQIYLCHKDFSKNTLIGSVGSGSSEIIKNLAVKRKAGSSKTSCLCLVQEKRVGWNFISQFLRKILKGGDDKMHTKNETLILIGKMAQISDALQALAGRLKEVGEGLLENLKAEDPKGPNGPNR